ncbi:MAG TPA: hypothetical protein VFC00_13345 [Micromonosporaceae bacterium]|nr:hypothetical protein [Micromonosporaceae bacterium]
MPEARTLRYWPWLIFCIVAAVVFGGLALVFGAAAADTHSTPVVIVNAILAIGLAVLAMYSIANLRVRSRIDPHGVTAIWPRSARRVAWRDVDRLDVAHVLPGWAVRGWCDDRPIVLFICHDTFGRRPKPETFDTPPVTTPKALHEGYTEIEKYWSSAQGVQPVK